MGDTTAWLGLMLLALYVILQAQFRRLDRRLQAVEEQLRGLSQSSGGPSLNNNLGDVKNPSPEALRRILGPDAGREDRPPRA